MISIASIALLASLAAAGSAPRPEADPAAAEPRVAVCHVAPGNPARRHTIHVGASGVAAHLAHGDTVGECTGNAGPCTDDEDCESTEFCERPVGACTGPGECEPRPDFCTEEFAPVCGCDGETYGNACFARMAGVSVLHVGECP